MQRQGHRRQDLSKYTDGIGRKTRCGRIIILIFSKIRRGLRVIIPCEEQGIKEFDDKEFLTRKTDKENKE